MLTIRLLAVCVALCFSSTTTVAGDFEIRTWDQAIAMAKSFVNQLTLQEKCHLTAGVGGVCAGNIPALPRVNFTGFCLLDAPSGPGDGVLYSTASVGGIHGIEICSINELLLLDENFEAKVFITHLDQ